MGISSLRFVLRTVALLTALALAGSADAPAQEPHPEVVKNLQTLYQAIEKYRADHDGAYPPLAEKRENDQLTFWPELLKPYLGDASKPGYVNPEGPFFAPYVAAADRRQGRASVVSFGYNRYALGADGPDFRRGRRPPRTVPHPAQTLLLVECDAEKQAGIGWYSAYPGLAFNRYEGKAHVLFCDGHVELRSPEELNVDTRADTNLPPWFGDLSMGGATPAPASPTPPRPAAPTPSGAAAPEQWPWVSVARMTAPPTIDGRIASSEWDRASVFTGYRGFLSRRLEALDVVTLAGYDSKSLHLAFIVPLRAGETPSARVTQRDGPLNRDAAVEVFLAPDDKTPYRQLIINALGTIYDALEGDVQWNRQWQVAAGRGVAADLPEDLRIAEAFWCVEISLPFAELQLSPPSPGTVWRANFALDGPTQLVFAPTFANYRDRAPMAYLAFQDASDPVLRLPRLGPLTYGRLDAPARVLNPGVAATHVSSDARAEKLGTVIVERTGFDEIAGAIETAQADATVAPGAQAELRLARDLVSTELNHVRVAVTARSTPAAPVKTLYLNRADMQILPPFRLEVENYPSQARLVCRADLSGMAGPIDGCTVQWRVLDPQGTVRMKGVLPLSGRRAVVEIDCADLLPAAYRLQAEAVRDGKTLASREQTFARVQKPDWLGNDIGKAPIVLPPFTPIECAARGFRVWGREAAWSDASLLPSTMTTQGRALSAAPIRCIVRTGGKDHALLLGAFEFTRRDPYRIEMRLSSDAGPFRTEVRAWAEYDGLIWFDMTLRAASGAPVEIESARVEIPLRRTPDLYYHAVPDRSLTGSVRDQALTFPFQPYFWLGDCDGGLGFAMESLRDCSLDASGTMHRVTPQGDQVVWSVNLVTRPVTCSERRWAFGLQATPVRPLPSDSSAWITANYERGRDTDFVRFAKDLVFSCIWSQWEFDKPETRWLDHFCDPMGVKTDKLRVHVEACRAAGSPAIAYYAPLNFTDDARPEHTLYAAEWMIAPRTRWKSLDFIQSRACARSSYQDFLLFAFRRAVREAGLDGLYFDGATSGECANLSHGCGWTDANGVVQPTWPILADREFNKRVAVLLHEEMQRRVAAGVKDPAPIAVNWSHISGAMDPTIFAFTTATFSGEWFKQPIRSGKSYRELLKLDTFRPRYLSSPWGIPNFFLPIIKPGPEARAETECILAYMLPHGVPLYPRYLDRSVARPVIEAMIAFDARKAVFTPCWRKHPALRVETEGDAPLLLPAMWERDGRLLAVIGNVGPAAVKVKLVSTRGPMDWRTIHPASVAAAQGPAMTCEVPAYAFVMVRIEP